MINPRIIPCLLLKGNGLVKTTKFKNPVYLGDPINTINIFNKKMVDEIIILDIGISRDSGKPKFDLLKRIGSVCFSPLTYGGGVSDIKDAEALFNIGIEKISFNTAAFKNPSIISEMAKKFGNQSVIVAVNVGKDDKHGHCIVDNSMAMIYNRNSMFEIIKRFEDLGAGEILINDVNRDGTMEGYDIELIRSITSRVTVPVIACGGCGNYGHLRDVIDEGGASAAAAGSIFVFNGPHKAVLISYPEHNLIKSITSVRLRIP